MEYPLLYHKINTLFERGDDFRVNETQLKSPPFASRIGTGMAEGIVARPIEPLFDRRGERIIIKLKTRDFTGGKRLK